MNKKELKDLMNNLVNYLDPEHNWTKNPNEFCGYMKVYTKMNKYLDETDPNIIKEQKEEIQRLRKMIKILDENILFN
jgi:polyhydroxyalkanoate synthesis regulator phasin